MSTETPESGNQQTETSALAEIRQARIDKSVDLRSKGINPYPSARIQKTMATEAAALPEGTEVTVAGRIMLLRVMGNLTFATIQDESGRVQFMLSKKDYDATLPEGDESAPNYKYWVKQLDLGDFVTVSGKRVDTKAGEPSVAVESMRLLTKSLRPLPDKHAGFNDEDQRLRQRHLDIMFNREVQEMIYKKSKFWNSIRQFLLNEGFVEVQTPALEMTTGGADARPFVTHHNFLDADVYLRISMGELWQKRLLVGGLEKTFEIGRQFRNEGQSREHANDYDQMEFYWAYADYQAGMEMLERLYKHMAIETFGTLQFELDGDGMTHKVDLGGEWQRYDFVETVKEMTGVDVLTATTEEIRERLHELKIKYDSKGFNRARAIDSLWKHCRRKITGPGFLINEPVSTSPLAKRKSDNPELTERVHVLIAGSELGNGYSELNDPIDQAGRFAEQQKLRDEGDDEAQMHDEEFVEALEVGMPPAFGFGMSERVFSFLMNKSLRECQIFPQLRRIEK